MGSLSLQEFILLAAAVAPFALGLSRAAAMSFSRPPQLRVCSAGQGAGRSVLDRFYFLFVPASAAVRLLHWGTVDSYRYVLPRDMLHCAGSARGRAVWSGAMRAALSAARRTFPASSRSGIDENSTLLGSL